jgi:hypothetical protein
VALIKVDAIGTEALQRSGAGSADIAGGRVRTGDLTGALLERVSELRRDDYVVSDPTQRLPQYSLAMARAVHIGGIEESDPKIDGPMYCTHGLVVIDSSPPVGPAVEQEGTADRPASQPHCADRDA